MNYGGPYSKKKKAGKFLFFGAVAAAFVLALGGVVMWLWNALLPDLLGVKQIKYWQAVGLLVLCRLLFGSFKPGGGFRKQGAAKRAARRERWMSMTDEERAEAKRRWKERCRKRKKE
ncbi:MAG: hypothetical protein AAF990_22755 [Bacteroidota bacterium]